MTKQNDIIDRALIWRDGFIEAQRLLNIQRDQINRIISDTNDSMSLFQAATYRNAAVRMQDAFNQNYNSFQTLIGTTNDRLARTVGGEANDTDT